MIGKLGSRCLLGAISIAALAWPSLAQDNAPAPDRSAAYYNFAMGHMYAEMAGTYGYRSEYVDKAIEHYRAALKADPSATVASEELTDIYMQAGKLRDAVSEAEDVLRREPDNLEAHRMLGRIYARLIGDQQQNRINEEMLKKAIEQYQKVAQKDQTDVDSLLMLGRLYKIAQNSPESEKSYRKALELDPDNEFAISGLALVYSDLGDNKRAIEMWRKLAEKDPRPQTLRALAGAYEQARDFKSASQTLARAAELVPRDVELKKNLAEDLLLADDVDGALKLYGELAASDPKDARLQMRLSQVYRQRHDFVKARAAQDKARQLDPDSLEIRYNEVNLLEAEGKYADAIARLREILDGTAKKAYTASEQTNRAVLFERLGLLYRQNEQFSEAVDAFQKIQPLDSESGARATAQVIDTYRQAKDYAKAEQEAQAAFKKYPNDRTVKAVRASVLADLGRTEEAAAATRQLLDGKNDLQTYLSLSQIYDRGKKYAEAEAALDSAGKLADSPDEQETIHFMRGAMLEKQNKVEQAEAEFRKVLELNPQNASALNYMGYMLADRNLRLAEAQTMIQRALDLEPNNGAYLDSLGWVNFRMGRLDDAENFLRQAIARVSRDPTVHDHLGDVYLQKGRLKEAISQWEISLREWMAGSQAEQDLTEVAKVRTKLEATKVRLARESGGVSQTR